MTERRGYKTMKKNKLVNLQDTWIKIGVSVVLIVLTGIMVIGCGSKKPVAYENPTTNPVENTIEIEETTMESSESNSVLDDVESTEKSEESKSPEKVSASECSETMSIPESTSESVVTTEPTIELTEEPTPEQVVILAPVVTPEPEAETGEEELTIPQRNSINMLNYITVLTQEINNSQNSRIYLDSVQSSLLNNMNLNAIDTKTQSQINSLWRTIDGYKMIDVKRERLDFIYEQNKAQTLRAAIPDPLSLLSTVQSGNVLKTAVSVLYMAVDSKASYESSIMSADLKYLQDNWELEDSETQELSDSQLNLLNYMTDMARDNGIPTECTLNPDSVSDFAKWADEENIVRKISWLESNEDVYKEFRTYWLELAQSYYNNGDYRKCLSAMEQYEEVATKIFRKDWDYAETLPMAIIAVKETKSEKKYVEYADKYVAEILNNCEDENWALRYFAAQIYIDLYACTEDRAYLKEAYNIAFENVNLLVDEQIALNEDYLAPVVEEENKEGYTRRQKEEVKEYNKLLNEKRKVELPPVSEAFYLNCDLLFALADERNVSLSEKKKIDAIIHGSGTSIFLAEALDNKYWAIKEVTEIDSDDIEIEFNGDKLVIPASCITDRSEIKVTISSGVVLDDWVVSEVKRPKNSIACSEFIVTLDSREGKSHKYTAGEKISISVIPIADTPEETIDFKYEVIEKKILGVFKGIEIERVTKW